MIIAKQLPPIGVRVWNLVVRIAGNCKGCPFRNTSNCSTCDCSEAAALVRERQLSSHVEPASAHKQGPKRISAGIRRQQGLAMIPSCFIAPADIRYAPWVRDCKARANDLRALRDAGEVEARRVNSKVILYRRMPR